MENRSSKDNYTIWVLESQKSFKRNKNKRVDKMTIIYRKIFHLFLICDVQGFSISIQVQTNPNLLFLIFFWIFRVPKIELPIERENRTLRKRTECKWWSILTQVRALTSYLFISTKNLKTNLFLQNYID